MHHPHKERLVDFLGVDLGQERIALTGVKCLRGGVEQLVDLRVAVVAPIDPVGRGQVRAQKAGKARIGILRGVAHIDGVGAQGLLGLGPGAPAVEQALPFHDLELDVDANFLEVLLQVLIHGQGQHLPRATRGNEHLHFDRFVRAVTGFGQQFHSRIRVVFELEARLAKPRIG